MGGLPITKELLKERYRMGSIPHRGAPKAIFTAVLENPHRFQYQSAIFGGLYQ
ncbi:hypothetical protein Mal64_34850 [Pseudobythopirellula maris]|uniref:Uncharacterized protein n=1 Tax=Pseudobythopirellula maris TaxID=2527991 RepID=A0A5C5ZHH1_9BACT|nr:hypothetical protein Mal64_34850 [Pseudobythopirellula maris]